MFLLEKTVAICHVSIPLPSLLRAFCRTWFALRLDVIKSGARADPLCAIALLNNPFEMSFATCNETLIPPTKKTNLHADK